MRLEYLKELFENNKTKFEELDIHSAYDLKDYLINCITSNMLYDFNISLEIEKLFKSEV